MTVEQLKTVEFCFGTLIEVYCNGPSREMAYRMVDSVQVEVAPVLSIINPPTSDPGGWDMFSTSGDFFQPPRQ